MRAIVHSSYGGPDKLRLADIPLPEPAKDQIRVKVHACAVNLSDWEYLVGAPFYARLVGGLFRPRQPVLGSDIVGTVDAIGPQVQGFATGDRVMGDFVMTRGGFAEYACVPSELAVPVPPALPDDVAACLPQAGGIALASAQGLQQGTRLLINGAGGGSGTMALQLAKATGAHVTVVDNAGKLEWLMSLRADAAIDYQKQDFTETGQQWDRIIDMVATRGPRRIASSLAPNGVYRALGGPVGTLLSLVIWGQRYRLQNKSIGMLLVPSGAALTARVAAAALAGKIRPHLAATMPLEAVPRALADTGLGKVMGKIVIKL